MGNWGRHHRLARYADLASTRASRCLCFIRENVTKKFCFLQNKKSKTLITFLQDILVSELLGSFSDNELSPECLDGAQKFLKPDGISIPSEYTSFVAPLQVGFGFAFVTGQSPVIPGAGWIADKRATLRQALLLTSAKVAAIVSWNLLTTHDSKVTLLETRFEEK